MNNFTEFQVYALAGTVTTFDMPAAKAIDVVSGVQEDGYVVEHVTSYVCLADPLFATRKDTGTPYTYWLFGVIDSEGLPTAGDTVSATMYPVPSAAKLSDPDPLDPVAKVTSTMVESLAPTLTLEDDVTAQPLMLPDLEHENSNVSDPGLRFLTTNCDTNPALFAW
jgi:hypothetical protein